MSVVGKILGALSGNAGLQLSEQLLFDKVVGFKGIVPGVGVSTIVHNVAYALNETTDYNICVLDTNYLYPSLYPLFVKDEDMERKDYLDFESELSKVLMPTMYSNVYLASLANRTAVDMLSSKDNEAVLDNFLNELKDYFDIILIDLSYELTNISVFSAIRCNKIIMVGDPSVKCMHNLRKSLNSMATLAVPFAKANTVVINKVLKNMILDIDSVFVNAGMSVIGKIPLANEIAIHGVTGKKIWVSVTADETINEFSECINSILDGIVQKTPLNVDYIGKKGLKNKATNKLKDLVEEPDAIEEDDDVDTILGNITDIEDDE
ncbi:CobQ/CobB/MinD/ParA nucleotide binding domain protein [compost metagenome]